MTYDIKDMLAAGVDELRHVQVDEILLVKLRNCMFVLYADESQRENWPAYGKIISQLNKLLEIRDLKARDPNTYLNICNAQKNVTNNSITGRVQ